MCWTAANGGFGDWSECKTHEDCVPEKRKSKKLLGLISLGTTTKVVQECGKPSKGGDCEDCGCRCGIFLRA